MSRLKVCAALFLMLATPSLFAGCGGLWNNSGGGNTASNDVFSCTTGSAATKSQDWLFQSAPVKPTGSITGITVEGDGVIFYAPGTSTISGKIEYEDRAFDSNGFTGATPPLPVRFAIVQAVEDGTTVLKETATAADGTYTLGNFSHGGGVITVRALTDSASPYAATARDNRDSSIYAVVSADLSGSLPAALSNQNLLAGVDGAGPAFNIFDNMILAQERLLDFAPATAPSQVTAYWYSGGKSSICYSCYTNSRIYLTGLSSDDDAYDDTVILHEMGHYVADVYSKDDSLGGAHALTGHYDLRLTWSEGWATFFGSLVRAVSGISSPEYYVDTNTPTSLRFSYEIESMSGTVPASTKGADNEVAVSAVLWDIYDANNEGAWDTLSLGWTEIWGIFDNDLPAATVATFETFWDFWEASVSPGQLDNLLAERDIRYLADVYEEDDTSGTAPTVTLPVSEDHTFFPAGDQDWFAINVTNGTQYTFKTENLGDGADTLITVYDTDGTTQLAQNDDDPSLSCTPTMLNTAPSTVPCLASKIVCTAKVDRTVYVLAEPYRPLVSGTDLDYNAASNPAAISQYGYYTLTITSQ